MKQDRKKDEAPVSFTILEVIFVRSFKRDIQRHLVARSLKFRKAFRCLRRIDSSSRALLFPRVRKSINRYLRGNFYNNGLLLLCMIVALCAIALGTSMPIIHWLAAPAIPRKSFWFIYGFLPYSILLFLFLRDKKRQLIVIVSGTTLILLAATRIYFHSHPVHAEFYSRVIQILGGASLCSSVVVGLFLGFIPGALLSESRLRRNTDGRLIVQLISIVHELETQPFKWDVLAFRARLVSRLDHIANIIQRDLPRQCRSKDATFNQWLSDRAWHIAEFVRDMKKWVMMPRSDTREMFVNQVSDMVTCIASGNWDGLPIKEVSESVRRARRFTAMASWVRGLVNSFWPLILIAVLNKLGIKLPDAISPYIYFGAVIWTAVSVISLLDPLYSAKFETVKSALALLPAGKKKE